MWVPTYPLTLEFQINEEGFFCTSTPQVGDVWGTLTPSNTVCLQPCLQAALCLATPVWGAAAKPQGGFHTAAFPAGQGAGSWALAGPRGPLPIWRCCLGPQGEVGPPGSSGCRLTGAESAHPAAAALGRDTRDQPRPSVPWTF